MSTEETFPEIPLWERREPLQAVVWTGDWQDIPPEWRRLGLIEEASLHTLLIRTNHGVARADVGDFIANDVGGNFYPIKRAIFRATYRPATEH